MRTPVEGPSIGVLLCESRSGPMVEFALDNHQSGLYLVADPQQGSIYGQLCIASRYPAKETVSATGGRLTNVSFDKERIWARIFLWVIPVFIRIR